MVSLTHLWLPIVLSAVFVFVASSVIHMALKYHNSDYHGLPDEEAARAALGKDNPAPGMYILPYCADHKLMGTEEMQRKFKEGPVGFLILRPSGCVSMGASLTQWFLYCAVVSLFCAYLGGLLMPPGTHYRMVFRIVGTAAFMAHAFGSIPMGIWWGQPWRSVAKGMFDGLVYALLTAGTFGWLWPH